MDTSDLQFPLVCHFRVIAEDLNNMQVVIETVLLGLGVTSPVERVNASHGGKYVSFNITATVDSREAMNRIDQELRLIKGVRMVM